MTDAQNPVRELARRQLDQRLERVRDVLPDLRAPGGGWIGTLRSALGMSQEDLARRLGVTRQAISQLEHREVEGSATLNALKAAAEALEGELAYTIVPARSIQETLEARARDLALGMLESVRHTMRLEDQEPDVDLEARLERLTNELLASPEKLWSQPDDA